MDSSVLAPESVPSREGTSRFGFGGTRGRRSPAAAAQVGSLCALPLPSPLAPQFERGTGPDPWQKLKYLSNEWKKWVARWETVTLRNFARGFHKSDSSPHWYAHSPHILECWSCSSWGFFNFSIFDHLGQTLLHCRDHPVHCRVLRSIAGLSTR